MYKKLKLKNIRLYIKMFYQFFDSYHGAKHAKFLNNEKTVEKIIEEKKSLIRFGDGEFDLLEGKSIHYQEYCPSLKKDLNDIVTEYCKNGTQSAYIVAMPGAFLQCRGKALLGSRLKLSCWSHTRYTFCRNYDVGVSYGAAMLFARGNEKVYEDIWKRTGITTVVFVHNDFCYAKAFAKKYNLTTIFVSVPSKNAYKDRQKVLKNILHECNNLVNYMVLVSAGPAGKIITYELAKRGIWSIDTGHCWDEPLEDERI